MPIDNLRLEEFKKAGGLWTAGPKLHSYLQQEAGIEPTAEQTRRDEVLIKYLSGELSHDDASRELLIIAGDADRDHRNLTFEANKSLRGLVDPVCAIPIHVKVHEELESSDARPVSQRKDLLHVFIPEVK